MIRLSATHAIPISEESEYWVINNNIGIFWMQLLIWFQCLSQRIPTQISLLFGEKQWESRVK